MPVPKLVLPGLLMVLLLGQGACRAPQSQLQSQTAACVDLEQFYDLPYEMQEEIARHALVLDAVNQLQEMDDAVDFLTRTFPAEFDQNLMRFYMDAAPNEHLKFLFLKQEFYRRAFRLSLKPAEPDETMAKAALFEMRDQDFLAKVMTAPTGTYPSGIRNAAYFRYTEIYSNGQLDQYRSLRRQLETPENHQQLLDLMDLTLRELGSRGSVWEQIIMKDTFLLEAMRIEGAASGGAFSPATLSRLERLLSQIEGGFSRRLVAEEASLPDAIRAAAGG